MRRIHFSVLVLLLGTALPAGPARAWLNPYARVAYGANQLRMDEVNDNIRRTEDDIQAMGYPAHFQGVALGYGPHASVGLWLLPGLRVGATYDYQKSYRVNRVHVPGSFFYEDDLDFRMRELGLEAAIRVPRMYGFTVGAGMAQADAKMIEGVGADDFSGPSSLDVTASGSGKTYHAYVGLEQSSATHVVGFLRLGYRRRDMGSLMASGTAWDGVSTTPVSGPTAKMDYSGYYVTVGMGYDLMR